MLRAYTHRPETGWTQVDDLSKISDHVAAGTLTWAVADITNLTPRDMDTIAEELGLHPLAIEDAFNARQRPKLEAYENHLFAVVHQLDTVDGQVEAKQIALFAGRDFVLMLHAGATRTVEASLARARVTPRLPGRGPSWVMHMIVDTVVDEYQSIADQIEDEVERLEDVLLASPTAPSGAAVYSIKQRLSRLRRYAGPGSRSLASFVDMSESTEATRETATYFRDVLDHILRINDQIRNVEDLLDALLELRRTEQANALNEVTKKLTGWAAIIAVPTFIASVYGMNFELVPASGRLFGFFFAIGIMVVAGGVLYTMFKKRRWL